MDTIALEWEDWKGGRTIEDVGRTFFPEEPPEDVHPEVGRIVDRWSMEEIPLHIDALRQRLESEGRQLAIEEVDPALAEAWKGEIDEFLGVLQRGGERKRAAEDEWRRTKSGIEFGWRLAFGKCRNLCNQAMWECFRDVRRFEPWKPMFCHEIMGDGRIRTRLNEPGARRATAGEVAAAGRLASAGSGACRHPIAHPRTVGMYVVSGVMPEIVVDSGVTPDS
jgi:hypothetical protein